ncbi:sulfite exporter TauE/SafE family protein [Halobacillus sp. Nhm2S1]|uniref:sulfite exporter TauE/SafE family protein n=1 Tax=Halobacillus sp. Nhm2S1 TaxID=2866716 RepID=UPI001C73A35D|nr:sulfite exporter TauE/SafE family protein [Halobacillus sp. Nhm2S1]MBX0356489.1 sulfite exporter TauE/SafE family protein [Halobacillus sp. Nhm2S1]
MNFLVGIEGSFSDSVSGGGRGPVNTPALLSQSAIALRKVIGTVDTSEFPKTFSATAGFFISLGHQSFSWLLIASFVIGGVIAAPIATWRVKILPSSILGVLAGGFIIPTNARTLLSSIQASDEILTFVYTSLISGYLLIVIFPLRNYLRFKLLGKASKKTQP